MTKIVGIRFRTAGKIYYFDPADFDLDMAMHVIVETARGIEMGTVLIPPKEVDDDKVVSPLKPVIRVATDEDEKTVERNKEKEKEAFKTCQEKIRKHKLDMKLVRVEYTFDGAKIVFYFTSDGRVDFRNLVKDLAQTFKSRIELRQIGARDEAKLLGGLGPCGLPCCCNAFLADFQPVSIKMAKEQGLEKVYVHCFLDGRDVPPSSGKSYVEQLQAEIQKLGVGQIATVMGRFVTSATTATAARIRASSSSTFAV